MDFKNYRLRILWIANAQIDVSECAADATKFKIWDMLRFSEVECVLTRLHCISKPILDLSPIDHFLAYSYLSVFLINFVGSFRVLSVVWSTCIFDKIYSGLLVISFCRVVSHFEIWIYMHDVTENTYLPWKTMQTIVRITHLGQLVSVVNSLLQEWSWRIMWTAITGSLV